jgi:peptidoglycan/xylan/chitin deacetylase (PgdA/CDA1 family)
MWPEKSGTTWRGNNPHGGEGKIVVNKIYYQIKPVIPRIVQLQIRRNILRYKRIKFKDVWPIDESAGNPPKDWKGWPGQRQFALVLTHDVDTERGLKKCLDLAKLEEALGFRSSFNFVPERYGDSADARLSLAERGFEIGVHGLHHDGKYLNSRKIFTERAIKINRYIKDWGAVGYRAPSMLHNLEWFFDLDIEYDASTFDTDPFEPHPDGVKTIFPFRVRRGRDNGGYIELPYTLPQDFTLFVLMLEKNNSIWKRKLDWIAEKGGMVLLNTHPDYMYFGGKKMGIEEYPMEYYEEFLMYIKNMGEKKYWHALPREMARWWMNETESLNDVTYAEAKR